MDWLNNVKNNIFPLSKEKNDIIIALDEWEYRGDVYDPESAEEQCDVCGHNNIRYQFEILNTINGNKLLIGSECVKKFNIKVIDDNELLIGKSASKKLDKDRRIIILRGKMKSVLNSLIELSKKDSELNVEDFIKSYKKKKFFTPHQLSFIIWKLDENNIQYVKTYFKLRIRKDYEKSQIINMEDWKLKKIYPCLSSSQKKFIQNDKELKMLLKESI